LKLFSFVLPICCAYGAFISAKPVFPKIP
jgi:hypothetical protein